MLKKNQKGFGAIELLIVIAIVIVVGFGVWYIWHSKNNTSTKTVSSSSIGADSTEIKTRTNYIFAYDKNYMDAHNSEDVFTSLAKIYSDLYSAGYLTKPFYANISAQNDNKADIDFIICSQVNPTKVDIGEPQFNNNNTSASVTVNKTVSSDSPSSLGTYSWEKSGGTWQLNSTDCGH
jgi:hypothetical protein